MDEHDEIRSVTIPPELAGQRLDKALAQLWPDLSRSRLKALIDDGSLEGPRPLTPSTKLRAGDELELTLPPPAPATPQPQDIPLDILYEDDALLVVNKPAGLVVHPAPGHPDGTLVNAVLAHCGDSLAGIGGERRPGIVHRLDKDTSGVMVVAKTEAAHHGLVEQFSVHSIEREYLAFTTGIPNPTHGTIDAPIGRHKVDRKRMAVTATGRAARTHYRVEEIFGQSAALTRCSLETGRTHQIRVHLSHIGHPVLGDPVYTRVSKARRSSLGGAADAVASLGRQALHAAVLGFQHPISAKSVRFSAALPPDLRSLHKILTSQSS